MTSNMLKARINARSQGKSSGANAGGLADGFSGNSFDKISSKSKLKQAGLSQSNSSDDKAASTA